MSISARSPRPIKVVLGEALDEIRERATYLERFGDELRDVKGVIRQLEKIVGGDKHPKPTVVNPAGETKTAILDAVRNSLEPLSMEQIAEKIGRDPAGWLAMQCKKLVGSGQLVEIEGRYGTPSAIGNEAA